ncbi:MFS transporter [Streptomyces abyssomicinicus]|uniref:MFS transporter n=1 Tax=Streptomyces abyssomicinicus TaxID=574929 RepID=UPI0012501B2B|nr:MFS transporter [Streptomyces abyssomicinicus]
MDRKLRAARLATFAYFTLNGTLLGMWITQIPDVERRAGISHAVLGGLLLLLAAGAFAGMRVVGPLADRFGSRVVVPASAALCSAALVLPGLATGTWTLGAALFVFGVGNGCLDVSMNTHAVQVEHALRRPVMSAFHATFSLGGVLAALAGARALGADWSPAQTLGTAAVVGLVVTGLAAPALLAPEPRPAVKAAAEDGGGAAAGGRRKAATPARIWAMAVLAFAMMLAEGVANDWSVLHLSSVLGASAPTAALAYGAFATTMTIGRFLTDRVAARVGDVAVLRYGGAVAALGLLVAALSPWTGLALAGWAVFGAGLSGCIPQLFSAAGHADHSSAGANVSRVAGLGYLGMLAGPAVIGWLTHFVPLNLALLLPVACCVAAACAAGILKPRQAAGGAEDARDAGAEPGAVPQPEGPPVTR